MRLWKQMEFDWNLTSMFWSSVWQFSVERCSLIFTKKADDVVTNVKSTNVLWISIFGINIFLLFPVKAPFHARLTRHDLVIVFSDQRARLVTCWLLERPPTTDTERGADLIPARQCRCSRRSWPADTQSNPTCDEGSSGGSGTSNSLRGSHWNLTKCWWNA